MCRLPFTCKKPPQNSQYWQYLLAKTCHVKLTPASHVQLIYDPLPFAIAPPPPSALPSALSMSGHMLGRLLYGTLGGFAQSDIATFIKPGAGGGGGGGGRGAVPSLQLQLQLQLQYLARQSRVTHKGARGSWGTYTLSLSETGRLPVLLLPGSSPAEWSQQASQLQQLSAVQGITSRLATVMLAPPSPRHQVGVCSLCNDTLTGSACACVGGGGMHLMPGGQMTLHPEFGSHWECQLCRPSPLDWLLSCWHRVGACYSLQPWGATLYMCGWVGVSGEFVSGYSSGGGVTSWLLPCAHHPARGTRWMLWVVAARGGGGGLHWSAHTSLACTFPKP